MKRYKILHQTQYNYTAAVQLQEHTLRLRPREGHELRIEHSKLTIQPIPVLRWYRDAEGNSVATAQFNMSTNQLLIESEIIIQKYDQAPHDFLVADYAEYYPFNYLPEDKILLAPYLLSGNSTQSQMVIDWVNSLKYAGERIQTVELLQRLTQQTQQKIAYKVREEPGVQSPEESLNLGSGSCRDSAYLFMEVARRLGFAARFVSGYTYAASFAKQVGSTHAWAEVFIPGAGWRGFDPSSGSIVGVNHIAVAVARSPQSVPPVAGAYIGSASSTMTVGVWVTELS
jgi:transglutaminase-like putative cysteine protease